MLTTIRPRRPVRRRSSPFPLALLALALPVACGGDDTKSAGGSPEGGASVTHVDPGAGPWELVPRDQVRDICKLDPDLLEQAETTLGVPWAIVRYGRLCYESGALDFVPAEAFSTTKTLGALVTGIVSYQTRDIPRTGRKTGPLGDEDRIDHWLDAFTYNPDAQVAHVLAMVGHNPSLAHGEKTMTYDIAGTVQINSLSDVMNTAIAQDPARLGANLEELTQRFLFGPLGMTKSVWSAGGATKILGAGWTTDVLDMLRLGLLMVRGGVWSGERVLSEEWVYRMTHPSFEDANTAYGYLTWLNSASNYTTGGIPAAGLTPDADGKYDGARNPGPCAPVSVYRTHPHGLSESPDCNYDPPHSCSQQHDVGVWQAVGLGGQVIQGHRGLDMVIAARELGGVGPDGPARLWDAIRPAVIAADPTYEGDEAAFCEAYGGNAYAPDLAP